MNPLIVNVSSSRLKYEMYDSVGNKVYNLMNDNNNNEPKYINDKNKNMASQNCAGRFQFDPHDIQDIKGKITNDMMEITNNNKPGYNDFFVEFLLLQFRNNSLQKLYVT